MVSISKLARLPSTTRSWTPVSRSSPTGGAGQLGEDRRTGQVAELAQCPGLDAAAGPDDAHPVTQPLDLGQDVARQQDRVAAGAEVVDAGLEDRLHDRVEARRRLVQDEELDVGGQRRHERHLLPVALGVAASLLGRVQLEALDQVAPAGLVDPAPQPAEQVDHLAAGQVRPQVHVAGHVGQPAVQGRGVAPGVAVEEAYVAGVRSQEPQQDPDGRRLAGAVRPEEAVHLPRGHDQVEAVQGAGAAEVLGQVMDLDRIAHDFQTTHLSDISKSCNMWSCPRKPNAPASSSGWAER